MAKRYTRLEWHPEKKIEQINQFYSNKLIEAGQLVENEAKRIVPVDTGRLRSAIDMVSITDNKVRVGADTHYAIFVELGTSKQAQQSYLRKGLDNMMREIKSLFGVK